MIHPTNDLRSHISGSSTSLFRVAFFPLACNPKVSNPQISVFFKDQVLRFEVSVDDSFGVDILKAENNAPCHKL